MDVARHLCYTPHGPLHEEVGFWWLPQQTCPARNDRGEDENSQDENKMCMVISLRVGEKCAGEHPWYKRSASKTA